MRIAYLLLAVLPSLAVSHGAHAAGREQLERAAKKACLTGDATKGSEILADLYIDTSEAVYIFNQGRCFEQNNRYEEAIARFREYLRKADTATETERSDARKHIADCEALIARAKAPSSTPAETVPTQPAAAAEQVGTQANTPLLQPAMVAGVEDSSIPASSAGGMRIAGVVVGATGGVAFLSGILLNLKHNGMVKDLRQHYDKGDESSSHTYKTLSQVGYGVGAALVIGGAILYLQGGSEVASTGGTLTLAPTITSHATGLSLEGSF